MRTTTKYGALLVVAVALFILVKSTSAASLTATPASPTMSNSIIDLGQISVSNTVISGGTGPYTGQWILTSSNTVDTASGVIPMSLYSGLYGIQMAFNPTGTRAYMLTAKSSQNVFGSLITVNALNDSIANSISLTAYSHYYYRRCLTCQFPLSIVYYDVISSNGTGLYISTENRQTKALN